jgi:nitrogen fixation/metabolism regulation signal transduction histidine kinase
VVALYLVGICFFGCLTGYFVFDSPYWMSGIWTGLITVGLFYIALQLVVQSERKLTSFLQALSQNDFSVTFSERKTTDSYDLHHAFNKLNGMFLQLRSDKEAEHQLLHVVVEHAAVPLICFEDDTHEVFLMNEEAKELFRTPFLQKIESLRKVDPELPNFLLSLTDSEKHPWKLRIQSRTLFLTISARHIKFQKKEMTLITFVDVSTELAAKEADTWRKLIRVLTHEISNSAIPLSTLSSYIYELLSEARSSNRQLTEEEKQDIMESLYTIDRRSNSLKEFVQNFRSLNQIPEPKPEKISLKSLVTDTVHLYSREFEKESIKVQMDDLDNISVFADKNLTHQIMINLVKNAIEAMDNMKDHKNLTIRAKRQGSNYIDLDICDSGVGIHADDIDQVFIPFFSTKKSGSGIGLSMSQQIMHKQKGDITVVSEPGRGSVFTLSFPA